MSKHRVLLASKRSKSGFKYVIHDPRNKAKNKPWSVHYRGYRSCGFASVLDAAYHVAEILKTAIISIPSLGATCPPQQTPASPQLAPDAWVNKAGVCFNTKAADMFGARIRIHGRLAVIKSWTPCSHNFGIVFDDNPDKVFYEDLALSKTWKVIDWEGGVWHTANLRPMCPTCGHPLGVGIAAWTKCMPCGQMEPGASSTGMFSRLRSGDPYR